MGYTTVRASEGAIAAAAELASGPSLRPGGGELVAELPLLVDQVQGEAAVAEPAIAARALTQARGDVARAVSLIRAWAAVLPRLGHSRVGLHELRCLRRITPGFREPEAGQYLGASLDYAQRLLDLEPPVAGDGTVNGDRRMAANGHHRLSPPPERFPRALDPLDRAGMIASEPPARAVDRTREPAEPGEERGAFLQLLARGETGAMTAMAYTALRGFITRQDPTLAELRVVALPVRVAHGRTGSPVTVGEVPVSAAEIVLYRGHDAGADARLTLGVGATLGRVERRAIAAAMLDAGCARARLDPDGERAPSDDEELLTLMLDGQEATGFVEHLKLPHHVTFTSDLDRVRAAQGSRRLDGDAP